MTSASAVLAGACDPTAPATLRRAALSTTDATATATTRKSARATPLTVSAMLSVFWGGVKNQLSIRLPSRAAVSAGPGQGQHPTGEQPSPAERAATRTRQPTAREGVGDHQDVDVLRPGDHTVADTRTEQAPPARSPARADDDLRGVQAPGELQHGLGRILGDQGVMGPTELLGEQS